MAKRKHPPGTIHPKPLRDERGHYLPGQSGNPRGNGRKYHDMVELARQHTREAILTLAEIMGDPSNKGSERVAAAKILLDRAWGQAPQLVVLPQDKPEAEADVRGYLDKPPADHIAHVARLLAKVGALDDTIEAEVTGEL